MKLNSSSIKIEIDITEEDLKRVLSVLESLSFSQIQSTVYQNDVDETYETQSGLRDLREKLSWQLTKWEVARSVLQKSLSQKNLGE